MNFPEEPSKEPNCSDNESNETNKVQLYVEERARKYGRKVTDWQVGLGENAPSIKRVLEYYNDLKSKRVLEIGCGTGGVLKLLGDLGAEGFGVDPDRKALHILRSRLPVPINPTVIVAVGEELPFIESTFNLVLVINVLEHCKSVDKLIEESLNILRQHGRLVLVYPNYLSLYEPHYGMRLPLPFKRLTRMYLRFRGRDPSFFDSLNFTSPLMIRRLLKKYKAKIDSFPTTFTTPKALLIRKLHLPKRISELMYRNITMIVEKD